MLTQNQNNFDLHRVETFIFTTIFFAKIKFSTGYKPKLVRSILFKTVQISCNLKNLKELIVLRISLRFFLMFKLH